MREWLRHRTQEEIKKLPLILTLEEALKLNEKLKKHLTAKQDKL